MLIKDQIAIGNKLYEYRKKTGKTQLEVAVDAGVSDRTYADIERGTTNMRVSTLLNICEALNIRPNDILTEADPKLENLEMDDLLSLVESGNGKEKFVLREIIAAYLSGNRSYEG